MQYIPSIIPRSPPPSISLKQYPSPVWAPGKVMVSFLNAKGAKYEVVSLLCTFPTTINSTHCVRTLFVVLTKIVLELAVTYKRSHIIVPLVCSRSLLLQSTEHPKAAETTCPCKIPTFPAFKYIIIYSKILNITW